MRYLFLLLAPLLFWGCSVQKHLREQLTEQSTTVAQNYIAEDIAQQSIEIRQLDTYDLSRIEIKEVITRHEYADSIDDSTGVRPIKATTVTNRTTIIDNNKTATESTTVESTLDKTITDTSTLQQTTDRLTITEQSKESRPATPWWLIILIVAVVAVAGYLAYRFFIR